MPTNIVIWGAGGHALVVADVLRAAGGFEIAGFLDSFNPHRCAEPFGGAMILGGTAELPRLRSSGITHAVVAIGDCAARLRLADILVQEDFELAIAIHPRATVASDVSIGEGTVIIAGAVINPAARIGKNVIINTCASVDHECVIEDGAHICPGVRLAGGVHVGRGAWVGIGAVVLPKVKIGAGAMIGAGAVVLKDVPTGLTAYGVPAKVRAKKEEP
jgi:UDP-N-acetylbacillosamine N-acetyltransferase